MLPTATGAGGTTVTANDCSALPPEFVAVTVTVALPDGNRRHRHCRALLPPPSPPLLSEDPAA